MTRTLVTDTIKKVSKRILIQGWVHARRDHGQIVFIDLRDRTGLLQIVARPELAEGLRPEDVVSIIGLVKARPEKLVNPNIETGTVELEAQKIEVLSKAAELPFDMSSKTLDVQLPTLLDHRALTLRHSTVKPIFLVQEAIMEGFRRAAQKLKCVEIFTPTIAAGATEGGAEVFRVQYYDHQAFLVQSPQLYKQMLIPTFERVYLVSNAYRAEPSVTTRHLSESIQLDCELGFVAFKDLLNALEFVGSQTLKYVAQEYPFDLLIPKKIPRVTMREAQKIILDRTGIDHTIEPDLMPEDEREICKWALEKHRSDLVTVTHYPTQKRAFYTAPDPADPEYSLSYDLLFRGVEILSGSQRVNDYDQLLRVMVERGLNPDNFSMYLRAFKYGMPPEGGFSFGLERMTMQILGLKNIREASLFPRDMERVDFRFSSNISHDQT